MKFWSILIHVIGNARCMCQSVRVATTSYDVCTKEGTREGGLELRYTRLGKKKLRNIKVVKNVAAPFHKNTFQYWLFSSRHRVQIGRSTRSTYEAGNSTYEAGNHILLSITITRNNSQNGMSRVSRKQERYIVVVFLILLWVVVYEGGWRPKRHCYFTIFVLKLAPPGTATCASPICSLYNSKRPSK